VRERLLSSEFWVREQYKFLEPWRSEVGATLKMQSMADMGEGCQKEDPQRR
jgi:hypothetical protein